MSAKKVSLSGKPTKKAAPTNADEWVASQSAAGTAGATTGKMKRLTLDIPEELHNSIKAQCAMRGVKMVDEIRVLLLQKYSK